MMYDAYTPSALQSQMAVNAYLQTKQLLLFDFTLHPNL